MFLNFVFSAACKQKRGGGNKQLSNIPKHNQAASNIDLLTLFRSAHPGSPPQPGPDPCKEIALQVLNTSAPVCAIGLVRLFLMATSV